MERKNTLLLTVIAVATLLVAVIGATFAYFTATATGGSTSTVTVQTSALSTATYGASNLSLTILQTDMVQGNGSDTTTADDCVAGTNCKQGTGNVSLEVGVGVGTNTCTYDIVYTPTSVFTNSSTNASSKNELTLKAVSSTTGGATTGNTTISELSLSGVSAATTLIDNATFAVTGAEAQTSTTATITWNFTATFFNRTFNQSELAGNTFGGTVAIANVTCATT